MNNFPRYPSLLVCIALLTLGACAQMQPALEQSSQALEQQADSYMAVDQYASAAQMYQLASKSAQEPHRSELLLKGADAAMQTNNSELAQQLLDGVSPQGLDKHAQAQFELLSLQIRIAGKTPAQALELLPPPAANTAPDLAAKIWGLRAQLFFDNKQTVKGVHALVQRDVWLVDPDQVKANDYDIWKHLREQPLPPDAQATAGDTITQGWLALARIAAKVSPDRNALEKKLRTWETRHPGHPATRHILPERLDYTPTLAGGSSIALALPLTGNYADAGAAVQSGFLAAYYAQLDNEASDRPTQAELPPNLRIYDTNALTTANELARRTRSDGVSMLVGPLQKSLATALAKHETLGIPVLALNYIDGNTVPANFYQFGLAPEDEARAAAQRALAEGWHRALALIPDGDWGSRVLDAFRDAFVEGGGTLVDYARYNEKKQDHAGPIKQVLRYGQQNPPPAGSGGGTSLRRQDVDLVFVAARPEQARQIRTQLRFYHASRLPVLATSNVYTGIVNPSKDRDLDGLMFADMPWTISNAPDIRQRRARSKDLWPQVQRRHPRLFALGYDAWLLAQAMRSGGLQPGPLFNGNTGSLVLNRNNQIHRELDWAIFKRGKPTLLLQLEPVPEAETSQPPATY